MKRKLFYLGLLLSNAAFAGETCNINGMWFAHQNFNIEYSLAQNGTTLTGKSKFIDDQCGAFILAGTINDNAISAKVTFEKPEAGPECEDQENINAVFTNNCALLKGRISDDDDSEEFNLYREPIKITSPVAGTEFLISPEPRMPSFKATAEVYIPSSMTFLNNLLPHTNEEPFTWKIKIKHNLFPGRVVEGELNQVSTVDAVYEPDFSQLNELLGGVLTLSVQYFHAMRDEKTYVVKGTNPGKTLIETMVTSPTLRHIACMESSYRQFNAKREGGIGFPVVGESKKGKKGKKGKRGGVGLFQAYDPKPKDLEIWNWKNNVLYGIKLFKDKRSEVIKKMANKELLRLNKERKLLGLPLCPKGSIPALNPEETDRETLRRYNAGREYKWEPRDGKNCEGKWVIEPTLPPNAEKNYVEEVLKCSING